MRLLQLVGRAIFSLASEIKDGKDSNSWQFLEKTLI